MWRSVVVNVMTVKFQGVQKVHNSVCV